MPGTDTAILVSESKGFSADAAELLRQAGDCILADLDRNALLSAVREADVLWVRLRHRIDAEVMAAAPRLKVIVTPTTGLNHIEMDAAEVRSIRVLSLRGEEVFLQDIRATAEHTMALLLSILRGIPAAMTHVREGGWNRDLFKGRELYGKTVGVIGYGRLGRIVARYLAAFGTRVLATDPNVSANSVEPGVTLVPLLRLLEEASLVTLHVILTKETDGFFGREQFAAMRNGAWLVNTSRGELLDETELLHALHSGRLAGAALDVLSDECSDGMKEHPLLACAREHDHLILTPHIGGCTEESMHKTEVFMAQKLRAALLGSEEIAQLGAQQI